MYVEKRTKSPIFTPPVYLTPPMKRLPLEFGIGVRVPNASMMGLSDGWKSFQIRLVVLIQYRLWQTATQPASHVAVAITLNAKASSLKSKCGMIPARQCARCGRVFNFHYEWPIFFWLTATLPVLWRTMRRDHVGTLRVLNHRSCDFNFKLYL